MKHFLITTAAAAMFALMPSVASARSHSSFFFGLNLGGVGLGYGNSWGGYGHRSFVGVSIQPSYRYSYCADREYYAAPAYCPAPTYYYAPPAEYVAPPVYYSAPPVYYSAPAVSYYYYGRGYERGYCNHYYGRR